jgi:hypothetical protein
MRARGAIVALILAIALYYFTLFWGFDALRVLTSPTYGLDDVWRSQVVFGLGRFIGLGPEGLIKLAEVFGALKLVVAGVCAVHVLDRFRALIAGSADPAILEGGMILVVVITVASVAPALWTGNADLVREQMIQLLLAGLAAALLIIERSREAAVLETDANADDVVADVDVPSRAWIAPWR